MPLLWFCGDKRCGSDLALYRAFSWRYCLAVRSWRGWGTESSRRRRWKILYV
jgi:hypothetical protein